MAIKSAYWPGPEPQSGEFRITGEEHQHLRVSRTLPGESVELFDGRGRVWTGEVIDSTRSLTRVRIVDERTAPAPEIEIVLAQAMIRNAAFEQVLEKAVEVGVTRIIPFRASRSNETGRGKDVRWRKIIVEAAKQSKHYHLPELDPVSGLDRVLGVDAPSKIVFAERAEGKLEDVLAAAPVLYLIGPEGGWTDEELDSARAAGFGCVRLGSHILRAETAAVVAAGLIAHHLGAL